MSSEKKIIDNPDICVACGAPTVPGEQICRMCQKLLENSIDLKPENIRMRPQKRKSISGIINMIHRRK